MSWRARKGFYSGLLISLLIVIAALAFVYFVEYIAHFNDIPCSFEKVEITNAKANSQLEIMLVIKNAGCVDSQVVVVFIDGRPLPTVNGGSTDPRMPNLLKPGTYKLSNYTLAHLYRRYQNTISKYTL
ncbi:MAG: hypothetical protein QXJ17_04215 [Nitrososphaeria archaeon]